MVSPAIRAGKGWRGRQDLAPRCSATRICCMPVRSHRPRHVRYSRVRATTTTHTCTLLDRRACSCLVRTTTTTTTTTKDSDRLVPSETGVERSSTIGAADGGSPNANSRPGVDVSAGKTRAVTSARRKKRIQKVLKRKARLRMLTRRAGSLARRIYKCGLHPAAMYGDEVSGISDVEWRSMQRLASAAHSPMTAGRSLWYDDPTTSSVLAPILRWSRAVRLAATHPRGETGEHGQFLKVLNLPALRRIWERGRSQRPERWRSVKGTVGATFLSLDRIKWTWPSPFQFFDNNNTEILLTTTSPALLKSMLSAAVCRTNQR